MSNLDAVAKLAQIAEENALWARDLRKHPELVKDLEIELTDDLLLRADRFLLEEIGKWKRKKKKRAVDKGDNSIDETSAGSTKSKNTRPAGEKKMSKVEKFVVSKASLVDLFLELGFSSATNWSPQRCLSKVSALPDLIDENNIELSKQHKKFLKDLLAAVKNGMDIVFESDEDEEDPADEELDDETPSDEGDEEGDDEEEDDEEEDEEDDEEDEEEEEEPAPKKEKSAAKGKPQKTPKEEPVKKKKEKVAPEPVKKKKAKAEPAPEPVKKKKAKAEPAPKKKMKQPGTPSNKEVIYKAWSKKKGKLTVEAAFEMVDKGVKEATIRNWMSMWSRNKGLPACAIERE